MIVMEHLTLECSTLGELCSGAVTDAAMRRARKRFLKGGEAVSSELRLQAIWTGAVTVPIGLLMYAFPFNLFAKSNQSGLAYLHILIIRYARCESAALISHSST